MTPDPQAAHAPTPQEPTPKKAAAPPDSTAPSATPGSRRPGGRTARTRAAVREAVLTGLSEQGYPGLTVEYVAEHSGVHKTTLYRRWGGLEGLVADALDPAGEEDWSPPDTGSLAGDLRALAREMAQSFGAGSGGAGPTALIAAAFTSARAADALRALYTERFERGEAVVRRGVERGEVPADTDAGALVRAVAAPLFLRLFVTREPVDTRLADQSASAAFAAARAGAFANHPSASPG